MLQCAEISKEIKQHLKQSALFHEKCPFSKHYVPAATHDVTRLLEVCDLIAGETDLSSSWDTFASFHVLCHGSTFTWQQGVTETGGRRKKKKKKLLSKILPNDLDKLCGGNV